MNINYWVPIVPGKKNKKGLTEYQQQFVDEYLIDLNQTRAIIRAGFKGKPSSAKTAATRMMSNIHVRKEVQRRTEERSAKTEITQERVLKELASIAFFDIRKIYTDKNDLKDISKLDDDSARAISQIDVEINQFGNRDYGTTKKVKIHDKLRALQLVGNHIGMFKEQTNSAEDIVKALKELSRDLPD